MAELWQRELRNAVSSFSEIQDRFPHIFRNPESLGKVEAKFQTLIPPYYLDLIDPKDPEDPIAKMAFPHKEELEVSSFGLRDPIGDLVKAVVPRLTHRYPDRALLHTTHLCPMYCRFCFRKNLMNEADDALYGGSFAPALEYLSAHGEIQELILTGGDPWMLSDGKLRGIVDAVAIAAPSVRRLRFHTRMPVTLPMRVTEELLRAILRPERFQTIVVTHFNHPREWTESAKASARLLRSGGVILLNQTVLLKGVNDSAPLLRELFTSLGNEGVLPYYLHHCDLVQGAAHFRTSVEKGREIWRELRGKLPGYLIPEYILDTPGGAGKVPIGGGYLSATDRPGSYGILSTGGVYIDPIS